jgi:hypothetical protein
MILRNALAASGLALSALLISVPAMAQGYCVAAVNDARVDANGIPATHSTPAEHTATSNSHVSGANAPQYWFCGSGPNGNCRPEASSAGI